MKRHGLLILMVGMVFAGGDALAATGKTEAQRPQRAGSAHAEVRTFGHKVSVTFKKIGGHLQKFFTGRDTISR